MTGHNATPAPEAIFFCGFGISVYQSSGGGSATNWSEWEKRRTLLGNSVISDGDKAGKSSDFWNLYAQDIERAASFGSNCFRFTFEWDRLQPAVPGTTLDAGAVARYHAILSCLEAHSLEPFATLHQFVHPLWFEKLDSFRSAANIDVFVAYATAVFAEFGPRVRFWTTFNEPGVASSAGHLYGVHPPGRLMRLWQHGRHQLNMLRAHSAAYDAIKAMPGGDKTSIGLVHNWFSFEPQQGACGGCCTPFYMRWVALLANRMWSNSSVVEYLRTGQYSYNPLWLVGGTKCKDKKPGCDHFGLNYYSRGVFSWRLASAVNRGDVKTDMPYALWADGLEAAVEGVSVLGVPIYITETGVADAGDEVRPLMIESYMAKVEEMVRRGLDLRGVMYWTLVDNFEWADGFGMKFGVYSFDHATQARTMRPSGVLLRRWFARLKQTCPQLRTARTAASSAIAGEEEKALQPAAA